jgi:hypothetical protein
MRNALFALPAIAFGMIGTGYIWIGVLLLMVFAALWGGPWAVGWMRRTDHSADWRSQGVVERDEESTLKALLAVLPRAGARWVRVDRSTPRTVRAGTADDAATPVVEIVAVLRPVSSTETRVELVTHPVVPFADLGSSVGEQIVSELSREVGLKSS